MRLNTESKTSIPVLVVFGATASGKTALAESLFSQFSSSFFANKAEVISADSMQVYKGMDIGTAKPTASFLETLPHHLIDVCTPNEQFSTGEFVRLADDACKDIFFRGKIPVVLGGTAFYIQNYLYGLPTTPQADEQTRIRLKKDFVEKGAQVMHEYLKQLDFVSANRIHIHDEYRILRALEVCIASGKPLSSFKRNKNTREPYNFCIIALHRERDDLNSRIEKRVDIMFNDGLENEVLKLVKQGFTLDDPGMQAIGYREFLLAGLKKDHLKVPVEISNEARQLIKTNSKKYAKRQITFFKSLENVKWFQGDDIDAIEKYIKKCELYPF